MTNKELFMRTAVLSGMASVTQELAQQLLQASQQDKSNPETTDVTVAQLHRFLKSIEEEAANLRALLNG